MSSVLSHSFKLQGFLLCIPSHSTLKFQVFVVTPLALHAIQRLLEVARFFVQKDNITSTSHSFLNSLHLLSTQLRSSHAQAALWEFRKFYKDIEYLNCVFKTQISCHTLPLIKLLLVG